MHHTIGNNLMPIEPSLTLIDHRIYTIALRKMPEFLDVFDRG